MPGHQSPARRPSDKLEYNNDSGTVTTVGESVDSTTGVSDAFSLDFTPPRRKRINSFSAYNNEPPSSDIPHQQSDRSIFYLLFAFVLFFVLQVWGFRAIATVKPFHPVAQFSTINPNKEWCPQAECHNSPLCQPCDRRFLIVIATGRSGSTTLNNMLDLLPGVRMAGENNGHLEFGFKAMTNLEQTDDFHLTSLKKVEGAWRHNPIPTQSIVCPIQKMFESINPPSELLLQHQSPFSDDDEIIGFKTVQLHAILKFGDTPEDSVEFLKTTFPCARFIINIRGDMEAQRASWLRAFGTELDGDRVRGYTRRLENIAAQLGKGRARLIDMSEWSQRDGSGVHVLNGVLDWLGFEGCRFPGLLHANKNGYGVDTQKYSLGDDCRRIGR